MEIREASDVFIATFIQIEQHFKNRQLKMLWSQDFLSGKLILRCQDHKPSGTCRKSGKPSGFDESNSEQPRNNQRGFGRCPGGSTECVYEAQIQDEEQVTRHV